MRALISVSDKSGVVEFALGLEALGFEILSTGGTYKILKDNGIKCLLFDLDNTSVPFREKEPSKKLIDLFEELLKETKMI